MQAVVTITSLGDIFLMGKCTNIYWLQTDSGDLTKVADPLEQYEEFLNDEEKIDNCFLPLLIEKLLTACKTLKENKVYSYKKTSSHWWWIFS